MYKFWAKKFWLGSYEAHTSYEILRVLNLILYFLILSLYRRHFEKIAFKKSSLDFAKYIPNEFLLK